MARLLALVIKPAGISPGQRFRLEQWAPHLSETHGIELDFLPFESPGLSAILHKPGARAKKAYWMLHDLWRRREVLARARDYDGVVIFRELSLLGPAIYERLLARSGTPHLLLAHNPDHFYEAEAHGIPLTLSGHTHGGQIRFPNGPPIIRQSRFCLDEGTFLFQSSLLIVSRGLGSVGLPWRWGADPEAILIEIVPPL